ncbi:MAG: amino acid adenylation domain-containing protein, partial [Acidobacteria bacterium]|nr:amino acid adenylation domain-containing protein [Acidobacteriota bacterium]
SHRALANRLAWMQDRYRLTPSDVVLQKTPISFDVSVWELLWPLMAGARLEMARPGGHRDPAYLTEVVQQRGVTVIHFVPSMLKVLLSQEEVRRCTSLRLVVSSGEALPPAVSRLFHRQLRAELENLYGPTEAAIDVTAFRTSGEEGGTVPIGRPITGLAAYVVDARLEPAPWGRPGELCLGGAGLARGYLGLPRRTAERFVPDALSGRPGSRLYRTGDRCRWRGDGRLEFLGRLDHQLKVRGWRVEPAEVEAALLEFPEVSAVAVLGQEIDGSGTRLVAFFEVRDAERPPKPAELRDFLGQVLPPALIPAHFVLLDALPRLASGKIDRGALPRHQPTGASGQLPRSRAEQELAEIWRQVLGVPQVGSGDNFVALGGDSILAMQVAARAHRSGLHLVPGDLFQTASLAELALLAGPQESDAAEELLPGPVPLTPAQRWFFDLRLPQPHHWNQSLLLGLKRRFRTDLLERALETVAGRHAAFRLRFVERGEGFRQELGEEPSLGFSTLDLEDLEPGLAQAQLEATGARLQSSLDLARGPLFHALYCALPEGASLGLVGHHLIVDAVSWRVLLQDLEAAYQALERGEPPALRPAPSPFPWTRSLEQAARQSDGAADAAARWLARPWHQSRRLPAENGSETGVEAHSAEIRRSLSAESTRWLIQRAPHRLRATPQEILLTALASAVRRWAGGEGILVDLEGHGRTAAEDLSDVVGWFTSRTPLYLGSEVPQGEGGPSLITDLLAAVKAEIASLPEGDHAFASGLYHHPSAEVRRRLGEIPRPLYAFNYLGRLDAVLGGSEIFLPEVRPLPQDRHPENPRPYPLEVNAWVIRGELVVTWSFAGERFGNETIEVLADTFLQDLQALLAAPAQLRPQDFPLCQLSTEELEPLAAAAGGSEGIEDILPLPPAQEGMLLFLLVQEDASVAPRWNRTDRELSGSTDSDPVFFNQLHCELKGTLHVSLLRQVWQEALSRHAVLRTSFHWLGLDQPVQVVSCFADLPWRELDWSRSGDGAGEMLEALLAEDRRRGFRLEDAPLLRLTLIRLGSGRHRLVVSYHHLILDGWSLSLLVKEVFAAYEARATERLPIALEAIEERTTFRDFVVWQRTRDRGPAEVFWRSRLAGWQGAPHLYLDRGPAAASGKVRRHRSSLAQRPTERLQLRARALRLTLSTLLQGAWALVLHEASGNREVVFGTVVSGREGGFDHTLGVLINALPVDLAVRFGDGAEEWLHRLQDFHAEARRFSFCALEEIRRWSPAVGQDPLFESLVVFENYPVESSLLEGGAGLSVEDLRVEERTNYPLTLFAYPGESLHLEPHTDTGRFDQETGDILLARLEHLLLRLSEEHPWTLGELLAPDELERQQLINGWNPSSRPLPDLTSVERAFALQAVRDPAAPALLVPSADGTQVAAVSYGRLLRRVRRLSEELAALGAGPEVVVALRFQRSPELLASVLAVLGAGAAFLPLDLSWPLGRCRQVLEEAGAHLLLTSRDLEVGEALGPVPTYYLETEGELAAARPAQLLLRSVGGLRAAGPGGAADPESLAYVLYTSGSTGRPKGVQVSRGALAAHCRWASEAFALSSRDRVLQLAALAFDASLEEIFPTLARGAALVLRTDAMLASSRAFWQACDRWGVTVADLPTVLWHGLEEDPDPPDQLPRSLRLVVLGGERARPEVARAWRRRYGSRVRLLNTYGPTEATIVSTAAEAPPGSPVASDSEALPEIPLGRALPHARAYVLDRRGRPRPAGVCGELALAGAGLARGYRSRPAETAERFVPDPWSRRRGGRMFLSGDLVRWNLGGELHYVGRRDRQIKIRGIRIEPGEIETVLTTHERIREAYVLEPREGSDGRLAAFYAPAEASPLEIVTFLRQRLPESMVPGILLPVEALPRGPSGKVDRSALPTVAPLREEKRSIPPRNATEEAVAEIFEEVLEISGVGALD